MVYQHKNQFSLCGYKSRKIIKTKMHLNIEMQPKLCYKIRRSDGQ